MIKNYRRIFFLSAPKHRGDAVLPRVFAIGEFPPPITGNARITEAVSNEIQRRRNARFDRISVTVNRGRGLCYSLSKGCNYVVAMWRLAAARRNLGPHRMYLVSASASGLSMTMLLVLFARLLRYEVFLHHHSFSIINNPSVLMSCINCSLGPSGRHIFLSTGMAEAFFSIYRINRKYNISHNLTHARSFWRSARRVPRVRDKKTLRIGLLSNLSFDKGLKTFIEMARLAAEECLPIEFRLAGPTVSEVELGYIENERQNLRDYLQYHGPLFGGSKIRFYRGIDVFVFPTQYQHEAQPIVIHEAFAAGCAVISTDRGCIAEDLNMLGGWLIPHERADDPEAYLKVLRKFLEDPHELAKSRARSLRSTQKAIEIATQVSNIWMNDLTRAP